MAKMKDMIEDGEREGDAALARTETGSALAGYQETPDFSSDDVFIPRLRLAQGLTREVQDGTAHPGQFLITGFAPLESVVVVPQLFARQRELRDDEGVNCFSRDGNIGEGEPGGDCNECPLAKWTQDDDDKRHPPACKFSYNYILYSEEHDVITSFRFKGMALNAGKMLNTIVSRHGLGQAAVRITGEQKSGKGRTYYVPNVALVPDPSEGLFEQAAEKLQASA